MGLRLISLFALLCASTAQAQMNVLLILVDDLRPEISTYEGPVATPNMDALAARGYQFDHAFANVPVCGASRASMLTGLAPTSERFLTFNSRADVDAPAAETLPAYFKRMGYHAKANGKVFDVIADSEGAWSEPVWSPSGSWHSPIEPDGRGEHLQKAYLNAVPSRRPPAMERADVEDTAYPDGVLAEQSAADLHRLAEAGQPFFLAVGFRKPHLPFTAPGRYWQEADSTQLPPTWSREITDLPAQAWHRSLELRLGYDGLPLFSEPSDEAAAGLVQGYQAAVRYVDALVGKLTAALAESGLARNTLIVLAGDHGWLLGEHRLWTKHTLLDTALRTPLIIVDPRRVGGQRIHVVADLLDVYPTLVDLAGLPPAGHVEGRSLAPLLDGASERPQKQHVFSRWMNGETVRTERFRYSVWHDDAGQIEAQMLFDLKADPDESSNLAESAQHADTLQSLHAALTATRKGPITSAGLAEMSARWKQMSTFHGFALAVAATQPLKALGILLGLICVGLFAVRLRRH